MQRHRFTFIHAADIHLDSPLRGLERYDGAPVDELRGATREAMENLVTLALDEGVDFVVIAGDLYDGDWNDYNTGLFLIQQLSALTRAHIPVFIVAGNHDADSKISRHLTLPAGVTRFPSQSPQTATLDDLKVALHGQSYAHAATTTDLSEAYPEPLPGHFNIGVLHTALDGSLGHDPYAPCSAAALQSKGYQYWALGHVHERKEISHGGDARIVFPGNIQGRHIKETGVKGCSLVTVEEGQVTSVEHRPLDVLRWAHCQIDVTDALTPDHIHTQVTAALQDQVNQAQGRLVAARVSLHGATPHHGELTTHWEQWENDIRARGIELGQVWIESVRLKTRPQVDLHALAQRDDALGSLLRGFGEEVNPELGAALSDQLAPLKKAIPPELSKNIAYLGGVDEDALAELWQGARQLVIAHLMSGEVAS